MKSDKPGKITDPKLPITISTHYQDRDQSDQRVSSDFIWQPSDRTRENLTRNLTKPGDLVIRHVKRRMSLAVHSGTTVRVVNMNSTTTVR
jgi:hypothetical protein